MRGLSRGRRRTFSVCWRRPRPTLARSSCFYEDGSGSVDDPLRAQIQMEPTIEVTDEEEVTHRLWPIYNPAIISYLQSYFAHKQVFIADGHHRYESALEYSRRRAGRLRSALRLHFSRFVQRQ